MQQEFSGSAGFGSAQDNGVDRQCPQAAILLFHLWRGNAQEAEVVVEYPDQHQELTILVCASGLVIQLPARE